MAISKVTSGGIADIAAALEAASDSNKFTDADHSKLDGIATTANLYVHPSGAGNLHVATGGSVGHVLTNTASGTGTWQAPAAGATTLGGLTDGYAAGDSVGLGTDALSTDDGTANKNTAIGHHTLRLNTSGYDNTAVGYKSQRKTNSGNGNTSIGFESLEDNTTGSRKLTLH